MSSECLGKPVEIIYSYSRADALRDGELIDVSRWGSCKKGFLGGFKIPVAITRALFEVIKDYPESIGEDVRGRTHDVLSMAANAARSKGAWNESSTIFNVLMSDESGKLRSLELFMTVSPGDDSEPVVTIGFPEDF